MYKRIRARHRTAFATGGFTIIEVVMALTIVSAMVVMFVPRISQGLQGNAIRSARSAVATHVARARGAAASRGCPATLHFVEGANSRVWVTSCPINGSTSTVDTVGTVDALSDRYDVAMTTTASSISFSPTGVAMGTAWTKVTFTHGTEATELAVSPVGKVSW